jgi:MFS family permease
LRDIKKIYLFGIAVLVVAYVVYGLAQNWAIIIIAMAAYQVGNFTSMLADGTICGNCLKSEERATCMAICETFGMGLLSLIAPLVGAWLVTTFGGVNVEGIRPLFFVCMAGIIITFLVILTQISNRRWGSTGETKLNFLQGISQVFREGHHLKRMIIISALSGMEMGVAVPYVQPFAHEFKGAEGFVLGAMVTASAVAPLVLGIPLGRLSDKIGRKKVIYLSIPCISASYLMLILAPNSGFLIASGALLGFIGVNTVTTGAMGRELVPPSQMGRWNGILTLSRMCFSALAVFLFGLIWDYIGAQWLFVCVIAIRLCIIPFLMGMPETLGTRWDQNSPD